MSPTKEKLPNHLGFFLTAPFRKLEDGNDIGSNLKVLKVARESIENKWYPFIGEKDEIEDNYNKLNINILKNNINYEIIFRIYNDGISFKYNVPSQEALSN